MNKTIEQIIRKALSRLGYDSQVDFSVEPPPQESFGDYSSNVALLLSRRAGKPPFVLAQELSGVIFEGKDKSLFSKIEAARSGFINFTLSSRVLHEYLRIILKEKEKYGQQNLGRKEKILVEYFQPNIAKPLHLGHLRTAVIGDALFRILKAVGYKVESDSHIGDWGTQFGLLLAAYKKWGDDKVIAVDPINELNKLYIRINREMETHPELREIGKAEFAKLERGDRENRRLWKKFVKWSWEEFDKLYDLFQIRRADHNWPESFYEDKMPAVVEELKQKKLLKESEGAQIVDLSAYNLGIAVIIKSDGATLYILRDLATYIYRQKKGFKRQIYVVDNRQKHVLAQTFKILELLGYIKQPGEAVHIDYGFLKLPEGVMSTRRGNVIGPEELLQEAVRRVSKIIQEKNPGLRNPDEVAQMVARGAVKYFDLSHNLKSDIIFRWEEVLNFEGNSGPYIQYTHARIKSILRKAGRVPLLKDPQLANKEEQALLRLLVKYPEVVAASAENYLPSYIAGYLFTLAGKFNNFYHKLRVLDEAQETVRSSRIMLVAAVAQVIKNGLGLLGIEAPEEM